MKIDIEAGRDYFKKVIFVCDSIVEYRRARGIRYPCGLIVFSIFFGRVRPKI
jgi:hypothetical protein